METVPTAQIPNFPEGANELVDSLLRADVIRAPITKVQALGGGVSSEIFLVEHLSGRIVVKRPLRRLRVAEDWFADPQRMHAEVAFLRLVGDWLPQRVPRVLAVDPARRWFAMEYLGPEWKNWKTELLQGNVATHAATLASETLADVHSRSWDSRELAKAFAMGPNFHELRLAPYFAATAVRCPEVAPVLRAEISRLSTAHKVLIHGDFSPKNILLAGDRFILLDAEVACFGDPSFDVSFLLCHLFLKALKRGQSRSSILDLAVRFWIGYANQMLRFNDQHFEHRTARLLLCLLLARIHGKSPVEYLEKPRHREFVSGFAIANLHYDSLVIDDLATRWGKQAPEN